ncbi:MAG: HlyD family efflux transporter periplasmic adaptor subunit [candidate division NC10 bacterium]|nr:HlyD family efflux transporter periplasmic adaptor subunit [candidate division NC10 bacterium]
MKWRWLAALAAVTAVAAVVGIYLGAFGRDGGLEGSGTVEARNISVGSKVGGRVLVVHVREGDQVAAGDPLVTFEDEELLAVVEQARAAVAEARANLQKLERGYRPEEIAEARANAARARAELEEARTGYRQEQVAQARADVERAQADAVNAERTYRRAEQLAAEGAVSRQERDDAEAIWKMAVARLQSAEQRFTELERGFRAEEVAAAQARYDQAEAVRERIERGFRVEEVAAARAEVARTEGALREAQARHRERQVLAPAPAVVEVLDVRPGDLLPPNTPVATLLERDQLYVRIYIPETRIGRVRLGQRAEVRVDSFPDQVFPAEVEQINQKAEFLPRNVQTREERIHQVFGVKLRLHDREQRIRAGMAADVRLLEP